MLTLVIVSLSVIYVFVQCFNALYVQLTLNGLDEGVMDHINC